MPAVVVILLVAAAGGTAVALQSQLVGLINSRLGVLEAVFMTYAIGGVLAAVLMVAVRGGNLAQWRELPPYAHFAGVFGLVIIATFSYSVAQLGVVRGLLLITVAQFFVGVLVDQFGWFGAGIQPLTLQKMAGIVLLLAGGWLVLR